MYSNKLTGIELPRKQPDGQLKPFDSEDTRRKVNLISSVGNIDDPACLSYIICLMNLPLLSGHQKCLEIQNIIISV